MLAHVIRTALFVGVLLGTSTIVEGEGVGPVAARNPSPSTTGGGHAQATPATDGHSPYADRFDPSVAIRSLTPEQVGQIERGEGGGFALPAELNGVPGPRHVLDLAAELDLSDEQEAHVQTVLDEMRVDAVVAGDRYLDAVLTLEDGFRDGTLAADDLTARITEVHRREGELAAAHLAAHLETAALLTPAQVAEYGRLRGYE